MIGNWVEVIRTCNLPSERDMDVVSKWLIITRACVFAMTLLSALIGGLLAAEDGHFSLGRLLLVAVGLVIAHAANNMVNDLFDVWQGVDTKDYPRANYAPHPILDHLVSVEGLIAAIIVCNLVDLAIAFYLVAIVGWKVMLFAVVGLAMSVFYVAPPLKLKHRGLGEAAIFLIWGPLMIGGTYLVMAGSLPGRILWASVPYGLGVTAVLMGKHLDKADKDRAKGVRTLPVVLGDTAGRQATMLLVWSYYLLITALVAKGWLPWPALLALLSLPQASRFLHTLSQPAPATPEEAFAMAEDVIPADLKCRFQPGLPSDAYPLWPLWFVAWGVWWVRLAGACFVLGLVLSVLGRLF
jgi:1,4-dihydroxy-2-naphthoate octaprenyltransferase